MAASLRGPCHSSGLSSTKVISRREYWVSCWFGGCFRYNLWHWLKELDRWPGFDEYCWSPQSILAIAAAFFLSHSTVAEIWVYGRPGWEHLDSRCLFHEVVKWQASEQLQDPRWRLGRSSVESICCDHERVAQTRPGEKKTGSRLELQITQKTFVRTWSEGPWIASRASKFWGSWASKTHWDECLYCPKQKSMTIQCFNSQCSEALAAKSWIKALMANSSFTAPSKLEQKT